MGKRPKPIREYLLCLALVAAAVAVYWPVAGFELTNFDDNIYIQREFVQGGQADPGLSWAFRPDPATGNWHPLTWISLRLDTDAAGVASFVFDMGFGRDNAGMHHLGNLVLHSANGILLFVLLLSLTGCVWRAFAVALLFAVHPLHVESVAWVAERKDVLSTLFWLLTTLAYVRYARTRESRAYYLALGAFALGLMAKPMLVSLPFVLLLLDIWPLGRVDLSTGRAEWSKQFRALAAEKMPFFALALASCVVTVIAQRGAIAAGQGFPFGVRAANAVVSYAAYVAKTFWPVRLAIQYPHPGASLAVWQVAASGLAFVGVTAFSLLQARRRPYITVGWLWFVITLLPVIGLLQVGNQAMADRYTYVPHIGLFVLLVWGAAGILGVRQGEVLWARTAAAVALTLAAAVLLGIFAFRQVGTWRNTRTLFTHALRYYPNNSLAHNNLGTLLLDDGEAEKAARHFSLAIKHDPDNANASYNLGNAYRDMGDIDRAETQYELTIHKWRDYAQAYVNLGSICGEQGRMDEAIRYFRKAVELNPNDTNARDNLANALAVKRGEL